MKVLGSVEIIDVIAAIIFSTGLAYCESTLTAAVSPSPSISDSTELTSRNGAPEIAFTSASVAQNIPPSAMANGYKIERERTASTIVVTRSLDRSSTQSNTTDKRCISPTESCLTMPASCLKCAASYNCSYGSSITYNCTALPTTRCDDSFGKYFDVTGKCEFCYQLSTSQYTCSNATCDARAPANWFNATCVVNDGVLCLGARSFKKRKKCNWSAGYRRSIALLLSITLGGFGADRFYLDDWRGALGKLFSFGGLGVWTMVDIVLIATGYLTPHDGSLYYD